MSSSMDNPAVVKEPTDDTGISSDAFYGSIEIQSPMPGFTRAVHKDRYGKVTEIGKLEHYVCMSTGSGQCVYCGRIMDQKEYDDWHKPWWKIW